MITSAARQSHVFSAGGYFDAFGYAKPENSNQKNIGNNWLGGAKFIIFFNTLKIVLFRLITVVSFIRIHNDC